MKRDVNKVRKSLAKRKAGKLKEIQLPAQNKLSHDTLSKENKKTPLLVKQVIFSGFLFLIILMILGSTSSTNRARQWLTHQLSEEFPFATVNVWYQEQFGTPFGFFVEESPIPDNKQHVVPVNGQVNQTFKTSGQGVIIDTINQPEVYAIEQGTVLFAGNDRETNKTIVIQHPDRSKSTYGYLAEINVRPYQFVQSSQQIGTTSELSNERSSLYFSLQKGNQFLDPIEAITVNDLE